MDLENFLVGGRISYYMYQIIASLVKNRELLGLPRGTGGKGILCSAACQGVNDSAGFIYAVEVAAGRHEIRSSGAGLDCSGTQKA